MELASSREPKTTPPRFGMLSREPISIPTMDIRQPSLMHSGLPTICVLPLAVQMKQYRSGKRHEMSRRLAIHIHPVPLDACTIVWYKDWNVIPCIVSVLL